MNYKFRIRYSITHAYPYRVERFNDKNVMEVGYYSTYLTARLGIWWNRRKWSLEDYQITWTE